MTNKRKPKSEQEKKEFFEKLKAENAAVNADPVALAERRAEQEFWDSLAGDGLEDE